VFHPEIFVCPKQSRFERVRGKWSAGTEEMPAERDNKKEKRK